MRGEHQDQDMEIIGKMLDPTREAPSEESLEEGSMRSFGRVRARNGLNNIALLLFLCYTLILFLSGTDNHCQFYF